MAGGMMTSTRIVATLGLTVGGRWWCTRRQHRRRTTLLVGLLVGFFVHPVTCYLALLLTFLQGERGIPGDSTLTPSGSLAGVWVYSFFSLLFTGWLSCPISAAICGTGFVLYARGLQRPLPQTPIACASCGADWSRGMFSQNCRECGGAALEHGCLLCRGRCGQRFCYQYWAA